MHWFSASTRSVAKVSAEPAAVWDVLTDPDLLARLTPLLQTIEADGDLWRWQMIAIPVVGLKVVPAFTERMVFLAPERIDFHHEPPAGVVERAGATGHYELSPIPGGSRLSILLRVEVELPLTRFAAGAVGVAMRGVLGSMGNRFSANLLDHLGAHAL